MNPFFIGLQFLTRISIFRQTVWTEKDFGESVKFFPAVGAVLGICYAGICGIFIFATAGSFPIFTGAFAFALTLILTGGIHFDGLSDSADGLFSGRDREKMLEIMKDSRVGAFGVAALITFSALEISALVELSKISIPDFCVAIYCTPIIGRFMMVCLIGFFPYARPEGMGKAFAEHTDRRTIFFAFAEMILLLLPPIFFSEGFLIRILAAVFFSALVTRQFGKFATKKLGGVTGDIYGAGTMLSELLTLTIFLICTRF